jgi:hypothetical protein
LRIVDGEDGGGGDADRLREDPRWAVPAADTNDDND